MAAAAGAPTRAVSVGSPYDTSVPVEAEPPNLLGTFIDASEVLALVDQLYELEGNDPTMWLAGPHPGCAASSGAA